MRKLTSIILLFLQNGFPQTESNIIEHSGFRVSMGGTGVVIFLEDKSPSGSKVSVNGGGGGFDLQLGWAVREDIILSLDLRMDATEDRIKINGVADSVDRDFTTLGFVGAGINKYFSPTQIIFKNIYVGLFVGGVISGIDTVYISPYDTTSNIPVLEKTNFGIQFKLGKEYKIFKYLGLDFGLSGIFPINNLKTRSLGIFFNLVVTKFNG